MPQKRFWPLHCPAMDRSAVMFDLDGTLADTLGDIAAAANHALSEMGFSTYEVPSYRYLAGQGVHRLFADAIGEEDERTITALVARFKAYYALHRYDTTGPYDGIPELLDALAQRGMTLAVLSNKPHEAACDMIEQLFKRWNFAAVCGQQEGQPLKPDPMVACRIADSLGVPAAGWYYVGDTRVDMETGCAAGFFTVGVTWGFRDAEELRASGADAIVNTPGELLQLITAGG